MPGLLDDYLTQLMNANNGSTGFLDPAMAQQAQASMLGQGQGILPQQGGPAPRKRFDWSGDNNIWQTLTALGAGIAGGSGQGWGPGIGQGMGLALEQQRLRQNDDFKKLALALQMRNSEAAQSFRERQLAQGDERNSIYRSAQDRAAERAGVPPGFERRPEGGVRYVPGGPADPKVISEQSLARGRSADVPPPVRTDAIKADQAYTNITTALDDYEKTIKRTGNVFLPGKDKDAVNQKRRNIQLQLKELFNLGVLNGPDLALMDSMLFDPNASLNPVSGNFGAAYDAGGRATESVKGLKDMLRGIRNSKTRAIGMPDVGAPNEPAIGEEVDPFGIR